MRAQQCATAGLLGFLWHIGYVRQHACQERCAFNISFLLKCLLRITAKGVPAAMVIVGCLGDTDQLKQSFHGRFTIRSAHHQEVTCSPGRVITASQDADGSVHLLLGRVIKFLEVLVCRVVALHIGLVAVGKFTPGVGKITPILVGEGDAG